MSQILLIFICIAIGIGLRYTKTFPKNTPAVLNGYILYVALPAMAFYYIPNLQLQWTLILPIAIAWICFSLSFLIFAFLGKIFGWSKKLIGCLTITAGLGNTSFVGIPIISGLYGEEGIKTLIVIDLPGTFVVLSTLGILTATFYSKNTNQQKQDSIIKKIITFPPFLAFSMSLFLLLLKIDFPIILKDVFQKLALTISPIALISVGFQLKFKTYSKHFGFLALGLTYKLIIFPLIILLLYHFTLGFNTLETKVCIIEAAMAPMITGAILANNYRLKPELSNMMVGIGIPISFITVGIWYVIVEWLFGL